MAVAVDARASVDDGMCAGGWCVSRQCKSSHRQPACMMCRTMNSEYAHRLVAAANAPWLMGHRPVAHQPRARLLAPGSLRTSPAHSMVRRWVIGVPTMSPLEQCHLEPCPPCRRPDLVRSCPNLAFLKRPAELLARARHLPSSTQAPPSTASVVHHGRRKLATPPRRFARTLVRYLPVVVSSCPGVVRRGVNAMLRRGSSCRRRHVDTDVGSCTQHPRVIVVAVDRCGGQGQGVATAVAHRPRRWQ